MTLQTATKLIAKELRKPGTTPFTEMRAALTLSVEALQAILNYREGLSPAPNLPLPGETDDD